MRQKHILIFVGGLVVASAMFVSLVRAQDVPDTSEEDLAARGLTFPVPELGNCASKGECRTYCNEPDHMEACIAFARVHGLMNEEEADRAEKFRGRLAAGGGPGGCTSPESCRAFCANIENLESCVSWADAQGFKDKHIDEAKKIQKYLKQGGAMPGGCTSRESCEAYCGDFAHAEECFAFADKAGLSPRGREDREMTPATFRRLRELQEKGETPGGCTSRETCEAYCRDTAHFEECVVFGEKVGFLNSEEAARARKTGGKGPGECNSEMSCRAYCNNPEHREECFKFAEERGILPPEEIQRAREGMLRLKQGIQDAPPEIKECLESVVGGNIIGDIQAGTLTPGPEIGNRVRTCFEKFGGHGDPHATFRDAPPEVIACLKEKLGDAFARVQSGAEMPTPEMADVFRMCFTQMRVERGEGGPAGTMPGGGDMMMKARAEEFLRSAPPEILACVKEQLGKDPASAITDPRFAEVLRGCMTRFGSREQTSPYSEGGGVNMMPPPPGTSPNVFPSPQSFPTFPPEVVECLRAKLGPDAIERLKSGAIDTIREEVRQCVEATSGIAPYPKPMPYSGESLPSPPPPVEQNIMYPAPSTEGAPSSFRQQTLLGILLAPFLQIIQ